MSKSLKFFIVLFLAFLAIMNYSSNTFAAVNMNSSALNSNTSNSSNTSSTNSSNTNSSKTSSSTLSSTVTTSDFDLELTNILCFALVVVGILLILLGIAILIRLKR